jgi:peptide/nickel transport system substrate-binding protein
MAADRTYWRQRVSRRGALAAGGAAALVAACGGGEKKETAKTTQAAGGGSPAAGAAPAQGQPKLGGTLRYHLDKDPGNLDPHLATDSSTTAFSNLAYNGLLKFKTGPSVDPLSLDIEGELAEKWETPDSQTVVLKIRQDVKWQNKTPLNGRAFTAEDAKFGVLRIGTNKPEFQRAIFFLGIDKIDVPDASTIIIKHKEPNIPFLTYLAVPYHKIVPREVVDKEGDVRQTMVGTGPFTLESYTSGGKAIFKKNPDYFKKGMPYLDGVELAGPKEPAVRLAAFRANETDITRFAAPDDADSAKKQLSGTQVEKFTPLFFSLPFGFDVTRAPLTDERVRQAIALVMDHPGIRRAIFQDEAVRMWPIPVGFKDFLADVKDLEFYGDKPDVAKAKQLMEAAGVSAGFSTTIDTNTSYNDQIQTMPLLQQMLKQININATELKRIEPAAFLGPTNKPGGFDMRLWNHSAFSEPDEFVTNFYDRKGSRNFGGWGNEQLDALIKQQRNISDKNERKKVLVEIQKILARTSWRIGLEQRFEFVGWYGKVKGWRALAADPGYYTQPFEHTWLDK